MVAALWLCFLVSSAFGQGWERVYGDPSFDNDAQSVIQTADQGYITLGTTSVIGGFDIYVIRTDIDGIVLWERTYGQAGNQFGSQIIEVADGFVGVGTTDGSGVGGQRDVYLFKIDNFGNLLWEQSYGDGLTDEGMGLAATNDGGLILVGSTEIGADDKDIYLVKTDADGILDWQNTAGGLNSNEEGTAVIQTANGSFVVSGYTDASGQKDVFVQQFTSFGTPGWDNMFGGPDDDEAFALTQAVDGSVVVVGRRGNDGDVYFIRLNESNGESIITDFFGGSGLQTGFSVANTDDGNVVVTGFSEISALTGAVFLTKLDLDGDIIWSQNYGAERYSNQGFSVLQDANGGYVIAGVSRLFPLLIESVLLIKTDSEGRILTNFVQGNIYNDLNNNCEPAPGEEGIEGWVVEARGVDQTFYGVSDEEGNYSILVDNESYEVSLIRPNRFWTACTDVYNISFTETYDTIQRNFPVSPETLCTDLEVDISTAFLQICESNTYKVTYCNNGTAEAEDAYVEITVDDDLTVDGFTKALTSQSGQLYRFDLGDIEPGACDTFSIFVTVDCNALLGQAHCMKAHIFPDSICSPTPGWTGGSIEIDGECDGDSLRFNILNRGTGTIPASQGKQFIIIEDIVLRGEQQIELSPGESIQSNFEANGSTYRITAEQAEGHPGNSIPTLAIEGCDADGSGYSIGFLTQFPEDDNDHFVAADCQENINTQALGPFFKRGYPKGYGDSLLIEPTTDLKYSINFQNTGLDTAIRVVIRDTLSAHLDPTTVRPGASSHDYTFEVYGDGILKFTFENINLPDSSTNKQASYGFVKFRVSQRPDNPAGSVIKNSAAVFFDFSEPNYTGITCHRIDEEFITVSTDNIFVPEVSSINVYPNPFNRDATFDIESSKNFRQITLSIYDLNGRLLRQEAHNSLRFTFQRENLASGLYIYQINSGVQLISSGKITIQ
ncbi:MAG: T9SS type A sorting domain-containing protein [Bacteroidota bacterium]